jgi:hypothetical protein
MPSLGCDKQQQCGSYVSKKKHHAIVCSSIMLNAEGKGAIWNAKTIHTV